MQCGSKRCVSFGSHCKAAQEISEVCVEGTTFEFTYAVWSVQCAKNIYQVVETSHGLPTLSGTQNSHLSGRHPRIGREQRHPDTTGALHSPIAGTLGVHHQPLQVQSGANITHCVSGTLDQLRGHEALLARGESPANYQQLHSDTVKGYCDSSTAGLSDWQIVSNPPGSFTSTSSPAPSSNTS